MLHFTSSRSVSHHIVEFYCTKFFCIGLTKYMNTKFIFAILHWMCQWICNYESCFFGWWNVKSGQRSTCTFNHQLPRTKLYNKAKAIFSTKYYNNRGSVLIPFVINHLSKRWELMMIFCSWGKPEMKSTWQEPIPSWRV